MATATILWTEPRNDRPDLFALLEREGCEVHRGNDYLDRNAHLSEDELVERVAGVDGLLVGGRDRFTRRVLEAAPKVLAVSKSGVGVDRIDVAAATELGIVVTNTPNLPEHTAAVAEHSVALALGLAKQLLHGDDRARHGDWRVRWNTLLSGKTAGIVGYGRIGRRVAEVLAALSMRVLAHDPYARVDGVAEGVDLDTLLAESDLVSLHATRSEGSGYLLSAAALARMKPSAVVVNTARGKLVDEQALAEAIRAGRIAGAALDVFEHEPLAPDAAILAPDLRDRLLLSPHRAGSVPESRDAMGTTMVRRHLELLKGRVPDLGVVNPEVLPHWRGRAGAPLGRPGTPGTPQGRATSDQI